MSIRKSAVKVGYSLASVLILLGSTPARALAQDGHMHTSAIQDKDLSPLQRVRINELVQVVRDVTGQFRDDPRLAEGANYFLGFGCVSGGDFGAMGLHYINMELVGDGEINPYKPEIILFEPLPNGKFRVTGADYLVDAATWDANHPDGPPELFGQLFQFFDEPNRFHLHSFYTLHVWAWKDNPAGTFSNWNPNVSCDAYNPPPKP
jgi:hypothetical protein